MVVGILVVFFLGGFDFEDWYVGGVGSIDVGDSDLYFDFVVFSRFGWRDDSLIFGFFVGYIYVFVYFVGECFGSY